MRNAIIFITGLAFLWSCGSAPEEITDYKTEAATLYNQFISEEKVNIEEFHALIKKYKTKASVDYSKSAFANKTSEVVLNVQSDGEVFQFVNNKWDNNTSLGKYNPYFGDQLILDDLSELLEQPLDSFRTASNDKGKYNGLKGIVDDFKSYSKLKYILVMQNIESKAPVWYGTTYEAGIFKGKLLLYSVADEELLSIMDVHAISSTNVQSSNFNNLGDAAKSDYYKNINTAIKESISKNYKIDGYLSSYAVRK